MVGEGPAQVYEDGVLVGGELALEQAIRLLPPPHLQPQLVNCKTDCC